MCPAVQGVKYLQSAFFLCLQGHVFVVADGFILGARGSICRETRTAARGWRRSPVHSVPSSYQRACVLVCSTRHFSEPPTSAKRTRDVKCCQRNREKGSFQSIDQSGHMKNKGCNFIRSSE